MVEKDWSKFSKGKYNGVYIGWKERFDLLLNDIYQRTDNNSNIAKKYNVSEGRVSQLKKELSQLKYKPKIVNGKIKCQICDKQEGLNIHHNHRTGETTAILCHGCNRKVGNNELEYTDKFRKNIEFKNEIYALIKSEGPLTIKQIVEKLEQKENYNKAWYFVKELLKENRIATYNIGKYGSDIYSIKKK